MSDIYQQFSVPHLTFLLKIIYVWLLSKVFSNTIFLFYKIVYVWLLSTVLSTTSYFFVENYLCLTSINSFQYHILLFGFKIISISILYQQLLWTSRKAIYSFHGHIYFFVKKHVCLTYINIVFHQHILLYKL